MFSSSSCFSLLLDDSRHFFSLSLGTDVSTQSLLQKSKTSLIWNISLVFHRCPGIWGPPERPIIVHWNPQNDNLPFETRSNSRALRSYGAKPMTSRTVCLTNSFFLVDIPRWRECLGATVFLVTFSVLHWSELQCNDTYALHTHMGPMETNKNAILFYPSPSRWGDFYVTSSYYYMIFMTFQHKNAKFGN